MHRQTDQIHLGIAPHPFGEGGRPGPQAGVEGRFLELFTPQAHLAAEYQTLVETVLLPGTMIVDGLPRFVGVAGGLAGLPPSAEAAV